jgi:hypothetical protein
MGISASKPLEELEQIEKGLREIAEQPEKH